MAAPSMFLPSQLTGKLDTAYLERNRNPPIAVDLILGSLPSVLHQVISPSFLEVWAFPKPFGSSLCPPEILYPLPQPHTLLVQVPRDCKPAWPMLLSAGPPLGEGAWAPLLLGNHMAVIDEPLFFPPEWKKAGVNAAGQGVEKSKGTGETW